jgi:selenocysteine lyase/cysteine desulfurase
MNTLKILQREAELKEIAFRELSKIKNLHILAGDIRERLGVFSFYVDNIHHNLITRLLNDRFGIQMRGGCSCAGTYGHFLLNVDFNLSKEITDKIDAGDLSMKPGWIRLSLHPTMTDDELLFITDAISQTVQNAVEWQKDYIYNSHTNEFSHSDSSISVIRDCFAWFKL